MIRFALLAALFLALCPAPAHAQYDYAVTGVAADDVLNIRRHVAEAGQVGDAEIVGTIPPGATGVAGTGRTATVGDSLWREVTFGGITGWVAARYLRSVDGEAAVPTDLACSGTEPFWSMAFRAGAAVRQDPDAATELAYATSPPRKARGRSHVWSVDLDRSGLPAGGTAVFVRTDTCSDGMSDVTYPIEFVLSESGEDGVVLSGCCHLAR
jgi:uncharacterized membrane protein